MTDELVEQQRKHFDQISEKYSSARRNPNHLLLKELIWENFLRPNASIGSRIRRVLEPMCGMAEGHEIVKRYLKRDFDYLGFDYSQSMVDIAHSLKPELKIEWNDVTSFEARENRFDFVILIGGLHHVFSRSAAVVRQLAKSIEPGGYFLSFEPTQNNFLARRVRQRVYATNGLFDADTEQGFEYADLQAQFAAAGFDKVDEVYPGLLAYVLYYNPDAFPQLNVGGASMVRMLFSIDRMFWRGFIGRKMSFATMTLWRRR